MRERLASLRDPVCIHDVSVYTSCEQCEIECEPGEAEEAAVINQSVILSALCPFCNHSLTILQQILVPTSKEEPATDG